MCLVEKWCFLIKNQLSTVLSFPLMIKLSFALTYLRVCSLRLLLKLLFDSHLLGIASWV